MKCVNMLDLAKVISEDVEIMGKRAGEKTNEDLIAEHELPYTYVRANNISNSVSVLYHQICSSIL